MTKNFKLVLALALVAMMMIMGMTSALAVVTPNQEHEVTITSNNPGVTHTYEAYQLFKGDLDADEDKLSNIDWGTGVGDGAALLAALKAADTTKLAALPDTLKNADKTASLFADCANASDVAKVLSGFNDTSASTAQQDKLDDFAEFISTFMTGTKADIIETTTKGTYKGTVFGDGYYFIKDTTKEADLKVGDQTDTRSKMILKIFKKTTITAKDTMAKSDKTITNDNAGPHDPGLKADTAAIGDVLTYKIVLDPIPDPTKYNKFELVMKDTMEEGLTFMGIDSVVMKSTSLTTANDNYDLYVNGTKNNSYSAPKDAVDADAPTGETSIKLVFKDVKNLIENTADAIGDKLVVTYKVTVNKKATYGVNSNDNTVHFEFSNNPNVDYDGDSNTDDQPKGSTPDSTTKTYLTTLNLYKVDATTNTKVALEGAIFELVGTNLMNVNLVTGEDYILSTETITEDSTIAYADSATYYKLKDGAYTTTVPGGNVNTTQYDGTENTYRKIKYTKYVKTVSDKSKETFVSGSDGIIDFKGLRPGTYTLEEKAAPEGFNKLDGTLELKIGWKSPAEIAAQKTAAGEDAEKLAAVAKLEASGGFYIDGGNVAGYEIENDGATFKITVDNKQGVTLPSTGGIGTTIFYVAGSLMVLAAAILLITKRRMGAND